MRAINPIDDPTQSFLFNDSSIPTECFEDGSIKKLSFVCMPGPKLMNLEWRIYFNKEIFDSNVVKKIIDNTAKTNLSKSIDGLKFHHFHEYKWF